MKILDDLHYTKHDEWIRIEGENALIGISDYAQDQLSDIVFMEIIVSLGKVFKQEELLGTVESVKAAADLYMPATGEVLEVNTSLSDSPETINADPYGAGWMLKIKLSDKNEIDGLMDARAYEQYIQEREA